MSIAALLVLAVGLAMDATAVAATRGLAVPALRVRDVVAVALLFGGFQALMPLLGAWLGARVGPAIEAWDHWVAFALLAGIGGKMLWEARPAAWRKDRDAPAPAGDPFALGTLLVLAVATSVDAFAAGITLALVDAPLVLAVATIGIVTALLSGLGVVVGRRFGALLGSRLELVGGLALIALAAKVLVEHLGV